MKWLMRMVLLCWVGLGQVQAGLFDGFMETKPPYPVTKSELVFGTSSGIQAIFWIDDTHAMLPAYAVPGGNPHLASSVGIYIWDINKNTFTRYSDILESPRLFQFDHGNIAFATRDRNRVTGAFDAKIGQLGKEKEITLSDGFFNHPELEASAGPRLKVTYENYVSTWTLQLHPSDGYIDIGKTPPLNVDVGRQLPGNPDGFLKLYRPGSTTPIELPILVKEAYAGADISYSDYLGKYVLVPAMARYRKVDGYPGFGKDDPYPIYFISPNGKVDVQQIPPQSQGRPMAVFPTREGLFWVSNTTRGNSKDAGGWLLKDGKVIKLFDQLVDGVGVSPDGCTIAYASNDHNPKTTEYVKVINLCGEPSSRVQ